MVLTTPLLEGLDGVQKMSKSLGNYVGITEPPGEMFGKLMSISDELMWRYYELLSFLPVAEVARRRAGVEGGRNPRDAKFDLGVEIVDRFHGAGSGARAQDEFVARFQQGAMPETMPELSAVGPGRIPGDRPRAQGCGTGLEHQRGDAPAAPGRSAGRRRARRGRGSALCRRCDARGAGRQAPFRPDHGEIGDMPDFRPRKSGMSPISCPLPPTPASGCRSASPAAVDTRGYRSRGSSRRGRPGTS